MNRREFLAAGSLVAARPATSATAGRLRAGAATSHITPALGCSLAGGMTDRIATDVHDELHVRGLALDNGAARIALAVVDSCVVPRSIIDRAKELIQTHTGLPPSHVLVSATHTHSAPPATHLFQSLPDPQYTEFLTTRIADCVRLAVKRLQPARIGWAVGREERLVFNRRYFMKPGTIPADPFGRAADRVQMNPPVGSPNIIKAAGPTDPDVGVVVIETPEGRPICVLGNYALHYVGGGGGADITADYYGAWANAMLRLAAQPFVPILSNACSGNINGVNFLAPKPVRLPPYVQMQQYADTLAAECRRVWGAMRFTDSVELAASIEELDLATRVPTAEELDAARKLLAGAGPGPYKDRPLIYARETVFLSEYPKRVRTPIQALRVGSLAIATFPGEAFVEMGLEVKAKSPFKPTLLIELANDYRGYLPTPEAHELGGYETWRAKSSYMEKQAAPKMVACALRQLEKVSS